MDKRTFEEKIDKIISDFVQIKFEFPHTDFIVDIEFKIRDVSEHTKECNFGKVLNDIYTLARYADIFEDINTIHVMPISPKEARRYQSILKKTIDDLLPVIEEYLNQNCRK